MGTDAATTSWIVRLIGIYVGIYAAVCAVGGVLGIQAAGTAGLVMSLALLVVSIGLLSGAIGLVLLKAWSRWVAVGSLIALIAVKAAPYLPTLAGLGFPKGFVALAVLAPALALPAICCAYLAFAKLDVLRAAPTEDRAA